MATCAVDTLLEDNPCYAALPPFLLDVVVTQMLCNILDKLQNGGAVSCDVQTLLDQGVCFAAMPQSILKVLQASLLCEITNAL